jgi:hypothetical protein
MQLLNSGTLSNSILIYLEAHSPKSVNESKPGFRMALTSA